MYYYEKNKVSTEVIVFLPLPGVPYLQRNTMLEADRFKLFILYFTNCMKAGMGTYITTV